MKIITIEGNENTGKTTLVKELYRYLNLRGAFVLYYEVTGAHYEDFHAVIIWNSKVIAFCSIGDYADIDENKADDKLWPYAYIKKGIELANKYSAIILINTKTSNLSNTDYKLLLKEIVKNENYISYKMKDNIFQDECIKQNQEILSSIIKEIEK